MEFQLTSHSKMSSSRLVITSSWLSGSWRSFLYSPSVYSCHLFLILLLLLGPDHFCPLSSPYSQKTSQSNHTRTTALSNSMKLSHAMWGHPRRTGHGGEVWQNVVHWRREWQATSVSCLENPMNSMKRQYDRTPKEELPRSLGAQYATGDQRRNKYRKNEGIEPKQKQYQLWMWLVIEARSEAVKSNIA